VLGGFSIAGGRFPYRGVPQPGKVQINTAKPATKREKGHGGEPASGRRGSMLIRLRTAKQQGQALAPS
jgi:hypothetical protein